MLLVKERVDVVNEAQAGFASRDSGFGRNGPSIKLLADVAQLVVVPVKGIESAKPTSQYLHSHDNSFTHHAHRAQSVSVELPPKPQLSAPTIPMPWTAAN